MADQTPEEINKEMNGWLWKQIARHFRVEYDTETKVCPLCGDEDGTIRVRRRNTSYVDEDKNWLISCKRCFDEDFQYFSELWEDYNRSRF